MKHRVFVDGQEGTTGLRIHEYLAQRSDVEVLRIDAATGLGLPSNPYWNGDGTSAMSRIWAYGFRNPFRFAVEPGPLYRIPRTLCFASGDAAVALGMARTCLETFVELARDKTPRAMPALLRDQAMVQGQVGQAEAAVRAGRAFLMETVADVWATVSAGGEPTLDQRATLRLATTHGIRLAAQAIDTVYHAAGVTAVYDGHVLQRAFQDIHVITQHLQGRLAHYELVGRHWLGLPVDEARL